MTTHTATRIDAGSFSAWLVQAHEALRTNKGMDVPCGDCVGCCTSSYSILLRPHDAALDSVPAQYLSTVSGLSYPHAKMDPLPNGHCPMFKEGKCSIYSVRPQTCLDYDCRIFAAAGMDAGAIRPVINQRILQWQFSYESDAELKMHLAVKAASGFISAHTKAFPSHWNITSPSSIAVLSIKVYTLFMSDDWKVQLDQDVVDRIILAALAFSAPDS